MCACVAGELFEVLRVPDLTCGGSGDERYLTCLKKRNTHKRTCSSRRERRMCIKGDMHWGVHTQCSVPYSVAMRQLGEGQCAKDLRLCVVLVVGVRAFRSPLTH